ncbi:MAG: response regulator [Planctomycetota bacterium]
MKPTVLVLDNDPSLQDFFRFALERLELRVVAVGSREEAEPELRAGRVALLLLDLNLGGGASGVTLVRTWRAAGLLPAFLVITGTPDDSRLEELQGVPGFQGVVAKPFEILELGQRIRKLACRESRQKVSRTAPFREGSAG